MVLLKFSKKTCGTLMLMSVCMRSHVVERCVESSVMLNLLGWRLAVLTATMAMQNSRTPQRAMLRTKMLGTTVSETRVMLCTLSVLATTFVGNVTYHAARTNMPDASKRNTARRLISLMKNREASRLGKHTFVGVCSSSKVMKLVH